MKTLGITAILLASLIIISCYADRRNELEVGETYAASSADEYALEAGATRQGGPAMQPVERKIIKKGDISFETDNVVNTKTSIVKMVAELEGYLSDDQVNDFPDRIHHRMTIRVAADKFDGFIERVAQLAKKLENKSVTAEDVTEEYIDVEARLRTKKELEGRYRELLKKANKVEEVLAIEREIGTLRSEIESIEGRFRYLKDRVAYSTLDINFYQLKTTSFGFGSRIGEGLQSGWTNLLWFLIALTNVWPFLLLFGGLVYLVRRQLKKKKEAAG